MKITTYTYPKSSFLSVDKDMNLIISKLFVNERLKKLLYYTDKDALQHSNITNEQMIEMIGKNIKNVPELSVDGSVLNYLIISCDNFTPNAKNPEFRDNIIEFDIICHFDQWNLQDFQLRPYRIAAEIDSMLDGEHLTGIGTLEFIGGNQILLTDEFAGLCLMYQTVHGEEDKKNAPKSADDVDIMRNYNAIFNNNPWNEVKE